MSASGPSAVVFLDPGACRLRLGSGLAGEASRSRIRPVAVRRSPGPDGIPRIGDFPQCPAARPAAAAAPGRAGRRRPRARRACPGSPLRRPLPLSAFLLSRLFLPAQRRQVARAEDARRQGALVPEPRSGALSPSRLFCSRRFSFPLIAGRGHAPRPRRIPAAFPSRSSPAGAMLPDRGAFPLLWLRRGGGFPP